MWDQRIGLNQIIKTGSTLCWAAGWVGEKEIYFDSVHRNTEEDMIINIHSLLCEADVVLHFNGSSFDLPTLNKEFLKFGLPPPSPYQQIDLLKTCRKQFRLASNKLDFVAKYLGLGQKTQHKGHELWLGCMNNEAASWKIMEEYNINDVILLEALYNRLLPWIPNHPNKSSYSTDGKIICPTCGSDKHHKEGKAYTSTGVYQRYECDGCGKWFRDTKNIGPKDRVVGV